MHEFKTSQIASHAALATSAKPTAPIKGKPVTAGPLVSFHERSRYSHRLVRTKEEAVKAVSRARDESRQLAKLLLDRGNITHAMYFFKALIIPNKHVVIHTMHVWPRVYDSVSFWSSVGICWAVPSAPGQLLRAIIIHRQSRCARGRRSRVCGSHDRITVTAGWPSHLGRRPHCDRAGHADGAPDSTALR